MLVDLDNLPPVSSETLAAFEKVVAVVAQLRNPQGGCPWDLKQTHASLRPYLLEEAYETLEAIDEAKPKAIAEELGDVLLQVLLHSQIAQDESSFSLQTVCEGLSDKLIRRHPHVFAEANADISTPEQVTAQWQQLKQQEKAANSLPNQKKSILAEVKVSQPSLSRALEVSKKAVAVGFEWPTLEALWQCVMSEFDELKTEIEQQKLQGYTVQNQARMEDELGDILFATVNLARQLKIHPEVALNRATNKFTSRFKAMEALIDERFPVMPLEKAMETLDFESWDALWREAKTLTALPLAETIAN